MRWSDVVALAYRARPFGDDPDMCIFEACALERYPEGQEPVTEWVQAEPTEENWGKVLAQDFANMKYVHKGMKSRGFRGAYPAFSRTSADGPTCDTAICPDSSGMISPAFSTVT